MIRVGLYETFAGVTFSLHSSVPLDRQSWSAIIVRVIFCWWIWITSKFIKLNHRGAYVDRDHHPTKMKDNDFYGINQMNQLVRTMMAQDAKLIIFMKSESPYQGNDPMVHLVSLICVYGSPVDWHWSNLMMVSVMFVIGELNQTKFTLQCQILRALEMIVITTCETDG